MMGKFRCLERPIRTSHRSMSRVEDFGAGHGRACTDDDPIVNSRRSLLQ
jgi:hypothetical protein